MIPLSRLREMRERYERAFEVLYGSGIRVTDTSLSDLGECLDEVERLRELVVKMDRWVLKTNYRYPNYEINEILNDETRKEVGGV